MWIFVIASLVISLASSILVKTRFKKYSRIENERGITGAEAARTMLHEHGVYDVTVESVPGSLTDHYDPVHKVIRLSDDVYGRATVAAVGVAMHEAGHAVQYAREYTPAKIRHAIVKSTNIASYTSYILVLLGVMFSSYNLLTVGIWCFLAVIFFQLITLPVEFNASGRAVKTLQQGGFLTAEETRGASAVLRAAAMTYVAALAVSLLNLMRLLAIRGRRR